MWSSIANLKENLNKIALDVHDDDEELEIYSTSNKENTPVIDRRNSRSSGRSRSPLANGVSSSFNSEIEQYKAEIKRLQESEAQIKALSVNYAALLKEKEEQVSRLNKENGSLKHNLEATREETSRTSTSKGNSDRSFTRQHKSGTLVKSRSGNSPQNGILKYDGTSNGISHAVQSDDIQGHAALRLSNSWGKEKELADLLEEKNKSLAAVQATYESQIKEIKVEFEKQRNTLADIQLRYEEEKRLNESFQEEIKSLKSDKQKTSLEMSKIRSELNEKFSEIGRLQMELDARGRKDANDDAQSLKRAIATLEKENNNLKLEKNELEAALRLSKTSTEKVPPDDSESRNHEKGDDSRGFPGKEEMEKSLQKLEKDLKETRREKDKALQELARLKQHLLEKESEESEKMDEDSKLIEELRQNNEYLTAQISHMERALKQATAYQEELKLNCSNEILKSKELIDDLNRKLTSCMSTIDAKNVELLNLQTALGQYYAEIEAKEHLEEDLARAREEISRLSGLLKDADQQAEASKREKEEILGRLGQSERISTEWKQRVNKLEEDNAKLRRALEQSMTRLNRMSLDSDYLVDRRIVIKILVTYFQRNHSKEVLDLMVRMLGFSDEDKQRIGIAQQGAGKGVVRGVLGIPGRLVGGILGGSSTQTPAEVAPENQSIADLWVDFLLKETEERERRGMEENRSDNKEDTQTRNTEGANPSMGRFSSQGQFSIPMSSRSGYQQQAESSSEFSSIPLTSTDSTFHKSRTPPRF